MFAQNSRPLKIKTEEYHLFKIYDSRTQSTPTCYLLKPNQKELFDQLVKIEDGVINDHINRRINGTINGIKQLPWWKRLFNQF